MCTSSTATPAATGGSRPGGAERKTSSGPQALAAGGERLVADLGDDARMRADRPLEPLLELLEVGVEPRRLADLGERAHRAVPGVQRDDPAREAAGTRTSPKPARAISAASSVRPGEAPDAGRQVRVGRATWKQLAEQRHDSGRTRAGRRRERAARTRDLEDPEPAAGTQHAAELAQRRARRSSTLRTPKPTVAASKPPSPNGSASRSPRTHSSSGALRRARSSIALREVEAGHASHPLARAATREVAGAAAGVEHAVAGPDDRLGREPPPAPVEPGRHHAVHRVVDRRDPVEHRAGRRRPASVPLSTLTLCPSAARARCRPRAGRARGRR